MVLPMKGLPFCISSTLTQRSALFNSGGFFATAVGNTMYLLTFGYYFHITFLGYQGFFLLASMSLTCNVLTESNQPNRTQQTKHTHERTHSTSVLAEHDLLLVSHRGVGGALHRLAVGQLQHVYIRDERLLWRRERNSYYRWDDDDSNHRLRRPSSSQHNHHNQTPSIDRLSSTTHGRDYSGLFADSNTPSIPLSPTSIRHSSPPQLSSSPTLATRTIPAVSLPVPFTSSYY